MGYKNMIDFSILVGQTIKSVAPSNEEIIFYTKEGNQYRMYHRQDCCESVSVEEVIGEWADIVGNPVLKASEETNNVGQGKEYDDSFTWTFYNISTIKGSVTIRWYGGSNGYYSESVDFEVIK